MCFKLIFFCFAELREKVKRVSLDGGGCAFCREISGTLIVCCFS